MILKKNFLEKHGFFVILDKWNELVKLAVYENVRERDRVTGAFEICVN